MSKEQQAGRGEGRDVGHKCVECGGWTEGAHVTVWIGPEAHHKACAARRLQADRGDKGGR